MFTHANLPIFVNVSPQNILDPKFYVEFVRQFDVQLLNPKHLVLEVVEYLPSEPGSYDCPFVEFNHLVRVAVDNTGQGIADFDTVILLNPDYVKIDRKYVDGISCSPDKQKFFSTALSTIGAGRLIVEGIETEDDLCMVQELGVELRQDYFWSQSREADELATLLLEIRLKWEQLYRVANQCHGDLTHLHVLEQS